MDKLNGVFELVGALLVWVNVRQVIKDKGYLGLNVWVVVFFFSWGVWNLIYYPMLHQVWSFVGGLNMVLANSAWVGVLWWFGKAQTRAACHACGEPIEIGKPVAIYHELCDDDPFKVEQELRAQLQQREFDVMTLCNIVGAETEEDLEPKLRKVFAAPSLLSDQIHYHGTHVRVGHREPQSSCLGCKAGV